MLITKPEEFAHVAKEWAIKYAGAPQAEPGEKGTGAQGSGGMSPDTARSSGDRRKERDEAARTAEYVAPLYRLCRVLG